MTQPLTDEEQMKRIVNGDVLNAYERLVKKELTCMRIAWRLGVFGNREKS